MKRLSILITVVALFFAGCTPDFDPQTDSDQRNATFRFETKHLFDDVLSVYGDDVALGGGTIDESQRIRISAFCYDSTGDLLNKATLFARHGESPTITFRHLMKNTKYHFIFLADVVEYENETDFIERWFHLSYQQQNQFYTKLFEYSYRAEDNTLWLCETSLTVENQTYDIILNKITHNGYICFINTADIDEISTACTNHFALRIWPLLGRDTDIHTHTFSAPIVNKRTFGYIVPNIDSTIAFTVTLKKNEETYFVNENIENYNRRPFLVFFNCATYAIEQINFY